MPGDFSELQIPLNAGTTESPHSEAVPDLETTLDFFYLNPTQEANIVGDNLSGHIYPDKNFGKKAFVGKVPCEEFIDEFLLHCPLYDNVNKRWSNILNENVQYDSALYTPVYDIFNAVVTHFQYHGSRVVFDTPHKYLIPDEEIMCNSDRRCWKSSPEIMVLATASGEMVQPWETDYPHCVAPIEIQTQKNANRSLEENIIQIAIYARQCFIRQNNRKAVYSLLITEKNVQLFMFDRGGVYHSFEIDIHESATDFIRLILGVVSPNEDVVGYDSGVFWCGQSQRFIKTIDADGELEVYLLDSPTPVFSRGFIQGVATCCWKGWGEGKEDVLVKDAWRLVTNRRTPETDFLTAAQGLVGVGQMISFEEGETISSLRGMDTETLPYNLKSKFRDRIFSRIVLKHGGKPVYKFASPEEVLYAFRDAIAGHQNLWNAGILHRDVSINNILIGLPGSKPGYRGLLIDLDLSVWTDPRRNPAELEIRTVGTRPFQSVNVLHTYDSDRRAHSHDYLDDLESFFYVLCFIACGFDVAKPKSKDDVIAEEIRPFPIGLSEWENTNPRWADNAKKAMYFGGRFPERVTDVFKNAGPAFENLLDKLFYFFNGHVVRKISRASPRLTLLELKSQSTEHYQTVLNFFDEAIEEFVAFKAFKGTASLRSLPPTSQELIAISKQAVMRVPLVDLPPNIGTIASPESRLTRKRVESGTTNELSTAKKSRKA